MIELAALGLLGMAGVAGLVGLSAPAILLAAGLHERGQLRARVRKRATHLALAPAGRDVWSVPIRGRTALLGLSPDRSDDLRALRPCLYLHVPTARLRLRAQRGEHEPELRPIGDPELAGWLVAGGAIEDRAVLTGEVRAALAAVRSWCNVSIFGGRLWLYVLRGGPNLERLEDAIAAAGRLVAALDRAPADPVERLARMAGHDPIPPLRAAALGRLRAAFADHPSAREVAVQALADGDPLVELEAALLLRERERLVRIAVDPARPAHQRGRAAHGLDVDGVHPALGEVEALLSTGDPEVRRVGVRLARDRGADAEALLLARLHPYDPLVAGIVQALGDLGTVDALAPLRELHGQSSSIGALRGLVEAAMARIRTRSEDRIGGLALVAAEGGELSVAPAGGELSATTPRG